MTQAGKKAYQTGTSARAGYPAHALPGAAFLSQLIAERDRLSPDARNGNAEAARLYARGARIAERRMPAGYRRAVTA